MTYLVQRLRDVEEEFGFTLCAVATDRIEQLERENAELRTPRNPPCARHCESNAFEIEKRMLVRQTVDYMEIIAKQRVAMKQAIEVLGSLDVATTSRTLGARIALKEALGDAS